MAKLLQNERMKLYKKPSTWVLSGVVILLMLSTVVLLKVINIVSADNNGYYSQADAWKDIYQSNLQSSPVAAGKRAGQYSGADGKRQIQVSAGP